MANHVAKFSANHNCESRSWSRGSENNRALVLQDSIGSLIMAIEYQVWYQSDTLVTL